MLTNTVRDYAWGAVSGIPELLGRRPDGTPYAELWIGAHGGAPSHVDELQTTLDEVIAADPDGELGKPVRTRFGDTLPFLLKVLAADKALSLQAHPNSDQALSGFSAEEFAGVPRDAPYRNYKDPRHKPEMIYALSRFEALCGFRSPARILGLLARFTGPVGRALEPLRRLLVADTAEFALRGTLSEILDRAEWSAVADEVAAAAAELAASDDVSDKDRRTYATLAELGNQYPGDVGIIIAVMLHRVTLEPGQALMLPAGNMHAYLRGMGIEVMASSDNVMRCGLTPKHVDTAELMKILDFHPFPVRPVEVETGEDGDILTPDVEDFQLQRVTLPGPDAPSVIHHGPAVALCTDGTLRLTPAGGVPVELARGESVYIGANEPEVAVEGSGTLFAATVSKWADYERGAA
nr:mannose-6-phosphate isomerase, class I [Spelaeicoccus albus]